MKQSSNSLSLVDLKGNATAFTVADYSSDLENDFRIEGSDGYCWNMQGGAGGTRFCSYNNSGDGNNNITKTKKPNLILKKRNIYDIIFENINYKKKSIKIKNEMKKYYCEISELKIDNELFKEEIELRKDINFYNLVRCMEFYRRTNLNIIDDIKKLKYSLNKIVKILDFLNLGYIVKFSEKKKEEEGNYEIEFSKINKDENGIDLLSKINKSINSSFYVGQ